MALWAQMMGLVPPISPQGGLGGVGGAVSAGGGAGTGGSGSPVGPQLSERTGQLLMGIGCSPVCLDCNCNDPSCHCDGPLPPGYGMNGVLDGYICC